MASPSSIAPSTTTDPESATYQFDHLETNVVSSSTPASSSSTLTSSSSSVSSLKLSFSNRIRNLDQGDKIAIAGLMSFGLLLIILSSVTLIPNDGKLGYLFQVEDIFNDSFSAQHPSINWISGSSYGSIKKENENWIFKIFSAPNNPTPERNINLDTILNNLSIDSYNVTDVSFSPFYVTNDKKYLILKTQVEHVYRHSRLSYPIVIDLDTQLVDWISPPSKSKVQSFTLNPILSEISFVRDFNVFVYDFTLQSEIPIVDDITANSQLFYGLPPWVYEEEIFGNDQAMWWSPDGKNLAFFRSNTSLVEQYPLLQYNLGEFSTPSVEYVNYPIPSTPIADVRLGVWYRDNATFTYVRPDLCFESSPALSASINGSGYIIDVTWLNGSYILFKQMNRAQNLVQIVGSNLEQPVVNSSCSGTGPSPLNTTLYSGNLLYQSSRSLGWFDPFPLTPVDNTSWVDQIIAGDSYHIGLFRLGSGAKRFVSDASSDSVFLFDVETVETVGIKALTPTICDLTPGSFDVTQVYRTKIQGNSLKLYFQKSQYDSPTDRTVVQSYVADIASCSPQLEKFSSSSGWSSASFSPDSNWHLESYSNIESVPHYSFSGSSSFTLQNNLELLSTLENFHLPNRSILSIQIDSIEYWVSVVFPPFFQKQQSLGHKFCAILAPYGGPTSVTTKNDWNLGFSQVLASQLNCIIFTLDGRGTGGRGVEWSQQVYQRLGIDESIDQLSLGQYLKVLGDPNYQVDFTYKGLESFENSINPNRIGIWGWSYGGFLTLSTLLRDATESELFTDTVFSAGAAVAPVTTWRLYDATYTERYMGLDTSKNGPYDKTSTLDPTQIEYYGRSQNSLLLCHGSGDDNVHFENSAQFIEIVQQVFGDLPTFENRRQFSQPGNGLLYPFPTDLFSQNTFWGSFEFSMHPNRDHSISGNGAREFIYRKILAYFALNL